MRKMSPAELELVTDFPESGPRPVVMRFDKWLQISSADESMEVLKN